jgi:hypothetical protein
LTPPPRRPLPTRWSTPAQTSSHSPVTQTNRTPPGNTTVEDPIPRLDTIPNTSHPQTPGEPVGIGTPCEEATVATVANSPATLGPKHPGREYTSSQPLPDSEDIPIFHIQHAR